LPLHDLGAEGVDADAIVDGGVGEVGALELATDGADFAGAGALGLQGIGADLDIGATGDGLCGDRRGFGCLFQIVRLLNSHNFPKD
jgi:hypothetical protein